MLKYEHANFNHDSLRKEMPLEKLLTLVMRACTRIVTSGEFQACCRRVRPPAMEVRGAPAAMRRLTSLRRLDVTARDRA